MRKRLAPSHDLCARMRFVPADDSSWRWDLIDKECSDLGEQRYEHVFWRYYNGTTRFDLDDPEIQPYIDREAKPETWKFKRLSLPEREQVNHLVRQGREDEAWRHAYLSGVTGLEHPCSAEGEKLSSLLAAPERTEKARAAILKATEDYAATAVTEVGSACYRGSQDLTPIEKKH